MVPNMDFEIKIHFHTVTSFSFFKMIYGKKASIPSIIYPIITQKVNSGTKIYIMKLNKALINIQSKSYENLSQNVIFRHSRDTENKETLNKYQAGDNF